MNCAPGFLDLGDAVLEGSSTSACGSGSPLQQLADLDVHHRRVGLARHRPGGLAQLDAAPLHALHDENQTRDQRVGLVDREQLRFGAHQRSPLSPSSRLTMSI
ncbi:MAG: hypothetical protein U0802_21110 [Candidatus Binatia bacterium]